MKTEVELAAREGFVVGRTGFAGGHAFEYILESSSAVRIPDASMSDAALTVRIPATELIEWAGSERVSMSSVQVLENGDTLKILVEKDFACLSPREGEEESDMFRHPDNSS